MTTQPPIQWLPGVLSLGLKLPWREADHSSPSSAEVKNACSYTSTPPIRLHGVVLRLKHGDNFTFYPGPNYFPWPGYGLDDRGSGVRFPAGAGNFSLLHRFQAGSGAHPGSYLMGTGDSFSGIKRPDREAYHSPHSSAKVKECVALYSHSPNASWRCGGSLSIGTMLPLLLPLSLPYFYPSCCYV
jgi:hypothetical protein